MATTKELKLMSSIDQIDARSSRNFAAVSQRQDEILPLIGKVSCNHPVTLNPDELSLISEALQVCAVSMVRAEAKCELMQVQSMGPPEAK